jgi:hypothetical protein
MDNRQQTNLVKPSPIQSIYEATGEIIESYENTGAINLKYQNTEPSHVLGAKSKPIIVETWHSPELNSPAFEGIGLKPHSAHLNQSKMLSQIEKQTISFGGAQEQSFMSSAMVSNREVIKQEASHRNLLSTPNQQNRFTSFLM